MPSHLSEKPFISVILSVRHLVIGIKAQLNLLCANNGKALYIWLHQGNSGIEIVNIFRVSGARLGRWGKYGVLHNHTDCEGVGWGDGVGEGVVQKTITSGAKCVFINIQHGQEVVIHYEILKWMSRS